MFEHQLWQPRRPVVSYVAGRWYPVVGGVYAAGAALASGSIKLVPFELRAAMVVTSLGVRITTLAGGGNLQLAIYGASPTTGLPTGSELAKTASITTAAAANVNANLAANVTLPPGLYWAAVNTDNATVVCQALSAAWIGSALCGGTTQDAISNAAAGAAYHLSTPVTFGTWGDLTSATFTEVATLAFAALQAKAA